MRIGIRILLLRTASVLLLLAVSAAAVLFMQRERVGGIYTSAEPLEYGYSDDEMPRVDEIADSEYNLFLELRAADKKYDIDDGFIRFCADDENINSDGMLLSSCADYLKTSGYDDEMWETLTGYTFSVLYDLYTGAAYSAPDITVAGDIYYRHKTTLAFAGDINLSDGWYNMERYRESGDTGKHFSAGVLELTRGADIFMVNNEFSVSERGQPLAGKTYTFRANPGDLSIYHDIGVDIVSLANNHVYDYGPDAFEDTLTNLDGAGILRVGAGSDIGEASSPRYIISGGMKIGFISATSAETAVFTPQATESTGGVMYMYDDSAFCDAVRRTAENCDFVIAYVHFGTENSNEISDSQRQTAHNLIDAGADMVIGAHPHVLQPIEYYNGHAIVYSLGNFWFNTTTADTAILTVSASVGIRETLRFIPCIQSGGAVRTANGDEVTRIISDMNSRSATAVIGDDFRVKETDNR